MARMTEADFFNSLADSKEKQLDSIDFYAGIVKEATVASKAAEILTAIKNNPKLSIPILAGMTGGMAGLSYLSSRPKKELDGRSQLEHDLYEKVKDKKDESKLSFAAKTTNRATEFAHGYAKASREHPAAAAGVAALAGLAAGLTTIKILNGG